MSSYKIILKLQQNLLRPVQFHLYKPLLRASIGLGLLRNYQPLPWLNINLGERGRGCVLRWEAIQSRLTQDCKSAMDVGCNIGFFTFKLAENNVTCFGIEGDRLSYSIASRVKELCAFDNVAFLYQILDPSNISSLPQVDLVLCLSLFHHFVRVHGFGQAKKMMEVLMGCARKALIFETGQTNETYMAWSKVLPHMGSDIEEWLRSFLLDVGAKRVETMGLFPTHLGDVPRYLCIASK